MREAILTRLYRWPWVKILLFLLPGMALLLVYLVIPLCMLVVMSFYRSTLFGVVPDFSWNNYLHFARNPMFANLLVRSIRMALTVTAISLLVSYPFAYFLARATRRLRAVSEGPTSSAVATATATAASTVPCQVLKSLAENGPRAVSLM